MKKIQTIIVEDEIEDLHLLENLLAPYEEIEIVKTADTVENAIAAIAKHQPELIFLDINLYGRNSFEILDTIKNFKLQPKIIFTTAYQNYMNRAFKYAVFDYLLKPINRQELKETIDRYKQNKEQSNFNDSYEKLMHSYDKLIFNTVDGFEVVDPKQIVFLETVKGQSYTDIHLNDGSHLIITKNIGEIENLLPEDIFFKLHRSYILNLNYVRKVNRLLGKCYLKSPAAEFSIPISREKAKKLKNKMTGN